ncbi:MAG: hypothetical protein GTN82_43090 [Candidatus Aminicenantes bacterium]|nr:hypothetical protein [Candidatus Aminicenantes bacterium]
MKILKKIEEELSSWNVPDYLINTVFLLFVFIFSTAIHEVGHFIVAMMFGCKAGIVELTLFQGATGFDCTAFAGIDLTLRKILIAYGGGLAALITGMFFWFTEGRKDMEKGEISNLRIFSIILFFLSCIFQLFPGYKSLDGYFAIQAGLNPVLAWGIWIFLVSLVANVVISEKSKEE